MPDYRMGLGLTFLGLGALLVALAIPLIRRIVRPNRVYGIRIPAAFASEEAWYRINRHGGFCLLAFGIANLLLGCLDFLLLPARPDALVVDLHLVAPLVMLVPFMVAVFLYPRR